MLKQTGAVRAATGRSAANFYLASWVAVAALGLGYIGLAATRPDVLGSILPLAEAQPDQGLMRSTSHLADEMTTLRRWVHELQHELAATKSTLQEQLIHSSTLLQRMAATEEKLSALKEVREPAAKSPAASARTPARAQAPALVPAPVNVAEAAAKAAPAAAAPALPAVEFVAGTGNVKVINAPAAAAPIATGSVPEAAAPAPAPAAPKAPASARGIEIGTAESLEALRARWGDLTGRNAEVLGDLAPRYRIAADGRAAPFTLLAGPFTTSDDALRTCNTLRSRGVSCRVGAYSGNAF